MEEQKITTTAGQGFGITALILGIFALITAPIPCIGILALIPGVLGVIFAIIALVQANHGHGARGLIITALVISILGTSISTVWILLISSPPVMERAGFRGVTRQLRTLKQELEGLEDELEGLPDSSGNYKITIEKSIKVTKEGKEEILEELEAGDSVQTEEADTTLKTDNQ